MNSQPMAFFMKNIKYINYGYTHRKKRMKSCMQYNTEIITSLINTERKLVHQ